MTRIRTKKEIQEDISEAKYNMKLYLVGALFSGAICLGWLRFSGYNSIKSEFNKDHITIVKEKNNLTKNLNEITIKTKEFLQNKDTINYNNYLFKSAQKREEIIQLKKEIYNNFTKKNSKNAYRGLLSFIGLAVTILFAIYYSVEKKMLERE